MVFEDVLRLAESGDTEAMNQLGAMYAEGREVERDPEQAFQYYKMAADLGHPLASSNLGFCYLYGTGTEKNAEEAYKAFAKAAFFDIGDAIVRLGDMYNSGTYVSGDTKTAYRLYMKAFHLSKDKLDDWGMQQVYSDVCVRIGELYLHGIEVETDIAEAISWFSNALTVYKIRERKKDFYCQSGLERTKEDLREAMEMLDAVDSEDGD
jgi:hypothetical protein